MPLASGGEAAALTGLLASRYMSLHTAQPSDAGSNEISTGGGSLYARQSVTFAQAGSNPTTASNTGVVSFPAAGTNWGTITHVGLWSASSGGTFLGWAALVASKAINTADIARWEIGELDVTAD